MQKTKEQVDKYIEEKMSLRTVQLLSDIKQLLTPPTPADAIAEVKNRLSEKEFKRFVSARVNMSSLAEVVEAIEAATGRSLTPTRSIAEIAEAGRRAEDRASKVV